MFILATFRILSFRTLPFIPQKKIRIEFSANYPLTTFRIPQSAFRKIPLPKPKHCKSPQITANQSGVRLNDALKSFHELPPSFKRVSLSLCLQPLTLGVCINHAPASIRTTHRPYWPHRPRIYHHALATPNTNKLHAPAALLQGRKGRCVAVISSCSAAGACNFLMFSAVWLITTLDNTGSHRATSDQIEPHRSKWDHIWMYGSTTSHKGAKMHKPHTCEHL